MKRAFISAAVTAAALSAFAAPVAAHAQSMPPMAPMHDGTMLTLAVEGSTTRVPDVAILRAGVVTQAPTAAAAMAQNAKQMSGVLAALRKAGVADRDIQTASVGLSPQYRYQEGQPPELTGYQATNSVTVRFRDIAKSGGILDALVGAGANNISGPDLVIDKPEAATDEARADAIAKARARAKLYADAAGMRVVRILSISEGGEAPVGPMPVAFRAGVQADEATQVIAGERDVSVTITVRFLLQ